MTTRRTTFPAGIGVEKSAVNDVAPSSVPFAGTVAIAMTGVPEGPLLEVVELLQPTATEIVAAIDSARQTIVPRARLPPTAGT
jgi:hypothetical protein